MSWSSPTPARSNKPPVDQGLVILTAVAVFILVLCYRTGYIGENQALFYAVLIPSIILHEVSHGALANLFGDPTAKNAGRLTLNPIRHVNPLGTFVLPAILIVTAGLAFGYAKPVPVNTSHMSRNRAMLVGLVGPFTNIVLAVLAAVALHLFYADATDPSTGLRLLLVLGQANVVLAAFNLIPIPPLDGSSVIERFLPRRYWPTYLKFRQYSMLVLLAVVLLFNGALSRIFNPAIHLWAKLLPWDLGI